MLHYEPQYKQAKVVILNDMGMKLLIAEIKADETGYHSKPLFISPFLRAIPHFYAECMRCIYKIYLAPEKDRSDQLTLTESGIIHVGNQKFA